MTNRVKIHSIFYRVHTALSRKNTHIEWLLPGLLYVKVRGGGITFIILPDLHSAQRLLNFVNDNALIWILRNGEHYFCSQTKREIQSGPAR